MAIQKEGKGIRKCLEFREVEEGRSDRKVRGKNKYGRQGGEG